MLPYDGNHEKWDEAIHEKDGGSPQRMSTYVALLRAINVGGRGLVRMDRLKTSFDAAGCSSVRTLLQSGNVIFDCASASRATTFERIRDEMNRLVGRETQIMFRPAADMERLVERGPFASLQHDRTLKLYVAFLAGKPRHVPQELPRSTKEAVECIAIEGSDAFLVSRPKPNGFYGFPNNFLEKELGLAATTRNWSTVSKIAAALRRTEG